MDIDALDERQRAVELRKFGLIFSGIILVLSYVIFPFLFDLTRVHWPAWPALILMLLALGKPIMLQRFYRGWMQCAMVIGRFNSKLLLILVFALLFIPIGLTMRLFGRVPIDRKYPGALESYRRPPDPHESSQYERMF